MSSASAAPHEVIDLFPFNRWEPIDSFAESEQLLEDFWKNSSTNGRDLNDMSLFRSGESFQRTGPPRTPFSLAFFSNDPTFAAGHTRRSTGDLTSKPLLKASSEERSLNPLRRRQLHRAQKSDSGLRYRASIGQAHQTKPSAFFSASPAHCVVVEACKWQANVWYQVQAPIDVPETL